MASFKDRYAQWEKNRNKGSTGEGSSDSSQGASFKDRYRAWRGAQLDLDEIASSITNRTNTWLKNHNTYLGNYNYRFSGRTGTYEDKYVADSGDWLQTVTGQKERFDQEAGNILAMLDKYGDYFNPEWANSIRDTLNSASAQQADILKAATGDRDYWDQFGDEGTYGAWQRTEGYKNKYADMGYEDIQSALGTMEAGEEKDWLSRYQYDLLRENEDFTGKAAAGWEAYEADREAKRQESESKPWLQRMLEANADNFVHASPDASFSGQAWNNAVRQAQELENAEYGPQDHWTEDERQVYGYLYSQSPEKASQYAKRLSDAKSVESMQQMAHAHPFLASGFSVLSSLGSGFEYLNDVVNYGQDLVKGRDTELGTNYLADTTNVIRGTVAEDVDWQIGNWDAFDFLYNTTMSGVDSMVGGLAFGNLGGAVLGLSAAAQGTNDALERGMSDGQAFWNGFFSGVFEGFFETHSIGNLNKLKQVSPQSVKDIAKNLGKSMLVNASEETLTEVANIAYDTMINGEFANYTLEELKNGAWKEALTQVIEAGASGALMGIGMGGAGNVMGYAKGSKAAKQTYGGNAQELVAEALEIDPNNTFAQKMQQRLDLGGKLSGGQLNRLVQQNEAAMVAQDQQAIQNAVTQRLTELGETGDVSSIAQALTKQAKYQSDYNQTVGQLMAQGATEAEARRTASKEVANPLSKAERKAIAESRYGTRVANEMNAENIQSGGFSSAWAENIGTNRIHAQEYGRVVETADNGAKGGGIATASAPTGIAMTGESEQDSASMEATAAQRLTELGETGDVATVATAITKQVTGKPLTEAEQTAMTESRYGSRVATETAQRLQAAQEAGTDGAAQTPGKGTESGPMRASTPTDGTESGPSGRPVPAMGTKNPEVESGGHPGVTMQVSTGKAVQPRKILSIEDGKVMIQTDSGTVASEDLEFGDPETDLLWNTATQLEGSTPESANGIIRAYRGQMPVTTYLRGAAQEFRNGYYNLPSGGTEAGKLTPAQRQIIYELGQKAAGTAVARAQAKVTAARKEAVAYNYAATGAAAGGGPVAVSEMESTTGGQKATASKKERVGRVHFDRKGRTFDAKRETALKIMEQLSRVLGAEFYVYESYRNKDGKLVYRDASGVEKPAPNGYYDPADGSIHIDLNAGADGKGTMLFTIAHELTHFIRQWSPAKFKVLANFLVEQYGAKGVSMEELVQNQIVKARRNGRTIDYDTAFEEVVADSMEAMLSDGNALQVMAQLKQRDKSLWQKICDWFRDLAADLKALVDAYKGVKPDSDEGRMVAQMQDVIGKLEALYADALLEAGENYQAAEAEKNTTLEGDVKMQTRSVNGEQVVWIENSGFTNAQLRDPVAIAQYIAQHIGDVYRIIESGQKVYIGKDLPSEYTHSKYTSYLQKKKPALLNAKNKASSSLGEMIEIATNRRWEATKHTASKDAKYGMYRYDTKFAFPVKDQKGNVTTVKAYDAELLIRNASNGKKYLYDIVNIKEDTANAIDLRRKEVRKGSYKAATQSSASTQNVAQPDTEVKEKFSDRDSGYMDAMDLVADEKTESVAPAVLFSERTWTESDYVQQRQKAAEEIARAIGVSRKKAMDYIDSVNSIAKMIAEDRVRLDYFSSPGRSSFVGNVEYGGSFDFSTLCKKRRLLTGTFTAIQKALPNTALTAEEILEIRNRMKEAGLEVSCGLCYVEGSRANMGQFAKEFLRLYKQYYPDAWQPNMADVNTPEGIEWVRINHPECYEQYEYFWNHYGTLKEGDKNLFASQQKPKLYQLHTEYKGEILEKFRDDGNVEEKNLNGGIRLQSFSDFEIVHLIDTMQIIMDMSRVGLAGQAYTKVPDFAWALGDTGLKINLSLIAKDVDENGRLIFDDVEGMPVEEAMRLRDRYSKNVGTILVAFNDAQLMAAMADERVDFIIPFHRSQWKKSQYEAMGLPAKTKDYTYMQNEKFIKPQYHEYRGRMVKDKATNYMPNEYWDFHKTGKENAENYLQLCARNNKRPKFYKLLQNNGDGSYSLKADGSTDGYWKLLIDFKMYDNEGNGSPQMAVKPDFNMAEATRMLNDYSGGHSNFPVAQGIVDSFVKEYKESHQGLKFSERDAEAEKVNRELEKENEKLREDVRELEGLVKLQKTVTGGTRFTKTSVEAAAGQLMQYAGVKGDKKALAGLLNDLYGYIAKGEELTWEGVKEAAQPAVDWLQSRAEGGTYGIDRVLFEQDLLRQVYDSYWNVSTLYTVADKAQKEITQLKIQHSNRMRELRQKHSEKVAKLKAEHREAIERVKQADRERLEKKMQQTQERYRQSRERNAENRRKAELRRKIRKTVLELKKILTKGDKKRNVKEGMKDLVEKALHSADILFTDHYGNEDMVRSGVGTEVTEQEARYLAEAKQLLEQLEQLPTGSFEAYQQRQETEGKLRSQLAYRMGKLRDVFARERARLSKAQVSQVLGDLAEAYASLQDSEQGYVSEAYQENVYQYLLMLQKEVGGTTVQDMRTGQLEELGKAYTMVLTAVRNANRMFAENMKQTREQLGQQAIGEVKKAGGEHGLWRPGEDKLSAFSWNNQKPVYAFERIGSKTLMQLYENIRSGEDSWARDMQGARDYYLEQAEKYGYENWDMKKQYRFTASSGAVFSLNLEQIMSLYAYSKRQQAHDHLLKGGFVFDGNTEVQISKMGVKMTYLNKSAKAYNVSLEILSDIVSRLTEEQKAFVDAMQDYLSDTMGGKGNEVTMQLYGVKLFNEEHYFPLRSAGQYMEKAKEADLKKQQGQISIVNSGFAKATTPRANNPVVLSGFLDVWADHVNEMSMYHSFVLPMEDFRRVYNYATPNTETGQSVSVNSTIENAYGNAATGYIDQLYRDLNGGAVSDSRESTAKALMAKFKKAAVFASLSVVIQQPSAISRAFALVDPKYFIGAKVSGKRHKALWQELKRYAPVAAIKEMGYFDTGMGKSAQDFLKGKAYHTLKQKMGALFTDGDFRDEAISKAPALADELTWCAIWEAVKRETRAKHPGMDMTSNAFLEMAGKRFTEVITRTQVYDSVLSRSANMRSKGAFMSMATAFMAEPTTTINMVEDALRKGRKGDRKYAARAMGAVLGSVILNSMLSSLVYAMRDDDEDETFLEKYAQSFATEVLDGINPITYYPYLKDIWSALQGFDIERADMSLVSKAIEAMTKLVQIYGKDPESRSQEALTAAWWNLADYVMAFTGIPVKNVRRDISGAINAIRTISQDLAGRDTSWGSLLDMTWDNVKNALPVVGWMPDKTAADKLYQATISGDTVYRKRLENAYETKSDLDSAIRKGLRANDARIWEAAVCWNKDDLEGYMRIAREIVAEGYFSQDNVVMAIQAEAKAMLKTAESTSESKAKGYFTAEKFAVAVAQGNETMVSIIRDDIIDTAIANGKTPEEAADSFKSAAKSKLKELFQAEGMTAQQAVEAMVDYFGMDEADAAEDVRYWTFQMEYPALDLTESAVTKYYEYAEPAGIDMQAYYEYYRLASQCVSDLDEDGNAISGSKKAKILAIIDGMDLTREQKDALYYANGWAESTIGDAPWH